MDCADYESTWRSWLVEMTHHEQVAPSHADDTDVREGLHDVVERGGGEGVDGLAGVGGNALVDHLGGGIKLIKI